MNIRVVAYQLVTRVFLTCLTAASRDARMLLLLPLLSFACARSSFAVMQFV